MELTKKQKEIISENIHDNWSEDGCIKCGSTDFRINDYIYELRELKDKIQEKDIKNSGTMIIPVAVISCKKCGDISLLNVFELDNMDLHFEYIRNIK